MTIPVIHCKNFQVGKCDIDGHNIDVDSVRLVEEPTCDGYHVSIIVHFAGGSQIKFSRPLTKDEHTRYHTAEFAKRDNSDRRLIEVRKLATVITNETLFNAEVSGPINVDFDAPDYVDADGNSTPVKVSIDLNRPARDYEFHPFNPGRDIMISQHYCRMSLMDSQRGPFRGMY